MISILDTGSTETKERRLPAPDLFASCPGDEKILAYFDGQFEAVYVILHPFIRPVSIDSKLFYPGTYPNKSEILATCEPVSWSEVINRTNLKDTSEIGIGLRTAILGLKGELSNESFAQEIDKLDEIHGVIRPCEGEIPALVQNHLFEAIQHVGHEWLWIGDEFCTERKLEWIDDLKSDYEFPSHCNIFTPDKSILLTTHWDSHFSFLCSNRENINGILEFRELEGFFCDKTTEVYWSVWNQKNT